MINYNEDPSSPSGFGYLRILHAVPDAPSVDVYADDKMITQNLPYGQYAEYIPVKPGNYTISLYVAGTKGSPVLMNMLSINGNEIFTVAAAGTLKTIGFKAFKDSNMPSPLNKAMIRFVHLSPNAPAVDITLQDGTILFSNISFGQLTFYSAVLPSNYTLQVRLAGTSTIVLTVPDVNVKPGKFYSVYAIGLVGKKPPLGALLVTDK